MSLSQSLLLVSTCRRRYFHCFDGSSSSSTSSGTRVVSFTFAEVNTFYVLVPLCWRFDILFSLLLLSLSSVVVVVVVVVCLLLVVLLIRLVNTYSLNHSKYVVCSFVYVLSLLCMFYGPLPLQN